MIGILILFSLAAGWIYTASKSDKQQPNHYAYQSNTYQRLDLKQLCEDAESGEEEAQVALADRYYKGENISQDYEQAFHWYKEAAGLGGLFI
jgi:TPR repeat protein